MALIKRLFEKYKSFIYYIVFGVLTTLINIVVYMLCFKMIGISNVISNVIAWFIAVLFAFITNKIWVFESKSFEMNICIKEFISFVAAREDTGVIEIFGVPLLVKIGLNQRIFGVDGALSKVIVSVVVVVLNYVFSKLIVFKNKKNK